MKRKFADLTLAKAFWGVVRENRLLCAFKTREQARINRAATPWARVVKVYMVVEDRD